MTLYREGLSPAAKTALHDFWMAWNTEGALAQAWNNVVACRAELTLHAEQKALQWASQADLASALVLFYGNWL